MINILEYTQYLNESLKMEKAISGVLELATKTFHASPSPRAIDKVEHDLMKAKFDNEFDFLKVLNDISNEIFDGVLEKDFYTLSMKGVLDLYYYIQEVKN